MIVRIMGQGQYEVDESLVNQLNAIDNRIVGHVSRDDQNGFRKDLAKLISLVKGKGDRLDPVKIIQSEIIIPPEDLTFEEAKRIFSGHGLIED
jgi:hypothetical protein